MAMMRHDAADNSLSQKGIVETEDRRIGGLADLSGHVGMPIRSLRVGRKDGKQNGGIRRQGSNPFEHLLQRQSAEILDMYNLPCQASRLRRTSVPFPCPEVASR